MVGAQKIFKLLPFLLLFIMGQGLANFQIEEATIDGVHNAMRKGEVNCLNLVHEYVQRIKRYNFSTENGPPINAIVSINPSVFEQARDLDNYYKKTHKFIGPLHCVPIILKDNIDSYDSPSSSGSLSLIGTQALQDAFITARLRRAGAILLAKGNMDEFAAGLSSISSRCGRTGNPYDTFKNPGGSSGGVAAAVNANFAMLGIGTDNSGSIRIPSAYNGLYGLRPSRGLISQTGIFPRGNLDGVAGPMARNVTDLAKVMDIIDGIDENDPLTKHHFHKHAYTKSLREDGLQDKRIGVLRSVSGVSTYSKAPDEMKIIYKQALVNLRRAGAKIIDDIHLPQFNIERQYNTSGDVEDINAYLHTFPASRRNFMDICMSKRAPTFGTSWECEQYQKQNNNKTSQKYKNVIKVFSQNQTYVEAIMKKNKLDALLVPINSKCTACYEFTTVNTYKRAVASNSGIPAITILVAYTQDKKSLPVAMQLIAPKYDEAKLISMAYAYEQHYPLRHQPLLEKGSQKIMAMKIPQVNNLISKIGNDGFTKVLKNHLPESYSGIKSQKIVREVIAKIHGTSGEV